MRPIEEIEFVDDEDVLRRNISNYVDIISDNVEFQRRAPYVRSWYAMKSRDGEWLFASSKFIGYDSLTADEYLAYYNQGLTGTDTEAVLKDWFEEISSDTSEFSMLHMELENFLSAFGRRPRRKLRIYVVDNDRDEFSTQNPEVRSERIVELIVEIAKTLPSSQLRQLRQRISA